MKKKLLQVFTKRTIIVGIIVVLGSVFVYNFFLKQKKPNYQLEKVVIGTVTKEVSETGIVKAQDNFGLAFKNSGKIEKIFVKVGDEVSTGEELAKLDTTGLSIQLSQAEASLGVSKARQGDAEVSLSSARQNLEDVEASAKESLNSAYNDAITVLQDSYSKISGAYSTVNDIQQTYFSAYQGDGGIVIDAKNIIKLAFDSSKVYIDDLRQNSEAQDKIDLALSKVKDALSSTRDSIEKVRIIISDSGYRNTISTTDKANLDTQKAAITAIYNSLVGYQQIISTTKITNEKNINTAKASVASLENQLDSNSSSLYSSQVEESQTMLSLLRNQISDASLKSPISGKIIDIKKGVGEIASPNETVVSMLSSGPFEIKVDIYEEDIVGVEVGNLVKINLVAFPEETLSGKVVAIDPAEKIVDGVVYYETTIDFDEIKKGVRSGMTADIAIEVAKKEEVLIISKRVIEKNNGEKSVKVYVNGNTENRIIKTGIEGNDYVEILSGLKQGEEVIASEKI